MSSLRTLAFMGASAVLLAGASGCGGADGPAKDKAYADESPKTIVGDAKEAMDALKTVRIAGDIEDEGETMSLDLQVSTTGDCTGTMSMSTGELSLLSVGGKLWFKGDDKFWNDAAGGDAAAVMKMVGDKWIVGGEDMADLSEICNWGTFSEEVFGDFKMNNLESLTMKVAGDEQVDGQAAVKLEDRGGDDPGMIYVLEADPHYILKMTGGGAGQMTFSDFDVPLDVKAPGPKQQIDFDNMG